MTKLSETKLFSVPMGKDAVCDCGADAETQYVLAVGKREAQQLAAAAKNARKSGQAAPDVACGSCIASRIASKSLFVTEVMKHSPIKWERVTDDLECEDCGTSIPFGVHAHFHAASNRAICGVCGVKRGWSDAKVASGRVAAFELKETLAALRRRVGFAQETLAVAEGKVELHKIGESMIGLGGEVAKAVGLINSFVDALATPAEKQVLLGMKCEVVRLANLLQSVKEEFDARLFFLDKAQEKVNLAAGALATPEAVRH
jgi:hypothetical protein